MSVRAEYELDREEKRLSILLKESEDAVKNDEDWLDLDKVKMALVSDC